MPYGQRRAHRPSAGNGERLAPSTMPSTWGISGNALPGPGALRRMEAWERDGRRQASDVEREAGAYPLLPIALRIVCESKAGRRIAPGFAAEGKPIESLGETEWGLGREESRRPHPPCRIRLAVVMDATGILDGIAGSEGMGKQGVPAISFAKSLLPFRLREANCTRRRWSRRVLARLEGVARDGNNAAFAAIPAEPSEVRGHAARFI
jgi:hypothetical protein